jgi:hypothetical protein
LFLWFLSCQSSSPWNNVWITSTEWLPFDTKTMAATGIPTVLNKGYLSLIYNNGGTIENYDFYFMHRELFGDATSLWGMLLANPHLVFKVLILHLKTFIPSIMALVWTPKIDNKYIDYFFMSILFVGLIYGAFRVARDKPTRILLVSSLAMFGATVIHGPSERYMFPMIPIFIMAASCFGTMLSSFLKKIYPKKYILVLPTLLLLVMFGFGNVIAWAGILRNASADVGRGHLRLLEKREASMKAAYPALVHTTQGCRGIMSLEPEFFGAFFNIPQNRVYDVWEIPPFGRLGDAVYKGLTPDRIDCVFVSKSLATGIGWGTNYRIRYQNYIRPYIDHLQKLGATTYEIPDIGQAIVLKNRGIRN